MIAVELGMADQWWGLKAYKSSGGLHARQSLDKIMNQTMIVKACW